MNDALAVALGVLLALLDAVNVSVLLPVGTVGDWAAIVAGVLETVVVAVLESV